MPGHLSTVAIVFALTLAATFALAFVGRRHASGSGHDGLAEEKLNRWLVGLSAGAAANSGFIVTGAVGLGYTAGMQWVLLPLGWLAGDIVFWSFFPKRLNQFGRESRVTTLSELVTAGLAGRGAKVLALLCAVVVLLCLSGYVSAQWLAGQKFIEGAFPISDVQALALFAAIIVAYTAIGGFRGSVYVDSLQAVIRIIGTAIALGAVVSVAMQNEASVRANWEAAGAGFLSLLPAAGWPAAIGMIVGFGAAALGFGLGQPHIVSRYLAGASPRETLSAWWIYIGFVQFTWIAMTLFGVVLRGVMPHLADPEAGVSVFFNSHGGAIIAGIIVADVFATIAATSNSLLVAMAQSVSHDIGRRFGWNISITWASALIGLATMALSLTLAGSVFSVALSSVSMMAAGIAPAVMVRVMHWHHDARSLTCAVVGGIGTAVLWKVFGYADFLNEAAPGILCGLAANYLTAPRKR